MDIVSTVVHQLAEEIQFLTAGLKLHRLTQPEWEMKSRKLKRRQNEDGKVKQNVNGK